MEEIISRTRWLRRRHVEVHIAAEGVGVVQRQLFPRFGGRSELLRWEEIAAAEAEVVGRRRRLRISRRNGGADVTVTDLIAEQAGWAATLITDELEVRARRADPVMQEAVPTAEIQQATEKLVASGDGAVPAVVDFLIVQGVFHCASDVHFEPFHHRLRVRYRIDGMLEDCLLG